MDLAKIAEQITANMITAVILIGLFSTVLKISIQRETIQGSAPSKFDPRP